MMRDRALFEGRAAVAAGILSVVGASAIVAGCFGSSGSPNPAPDGGEEAFDGAIADSSGDAPSTVSPAEGGGQADAEAGANGDATTDGAAASGGEGGVGLHVLRAAVGASNMCIELPDTSVECLGYNVEGQDGIGTSVGVYSPTVVPGLTGVTAIAASGLEVCAILADTSETCWGVNTEGELGIGNMTGPDMCSLACAWSPTPVPGLTGVTGLAMGGNHTCALLAGGTVDCWGENGNGQVGNGATGTTTDSPGAVMGLTGATAIAAGDTHSCAIVSDKTVRCWGSDSQGELGDGMTADEPTPVTAAGVANVVAISAGTNFTCVVKGDGTVACWGMGGNGQLGDGMSTSSPTPVTATGLSGITAIGTGTGFQGETTCALKSDGTVWCWGLNNGGQVGDGTMTNAPSPVEVPGITTATAISVGANGACAVTADQLLHCWGGVGFQRTDLTPWVLP